MMRGMWRECLVLEVYRESFVWLKICEENVV